jgi:hypothetical protein
MQNACNIVINLFCVLTIRQTPEDSSFTEGLDVIMSRNGSSYTNANTALAKFASFVANNTQLFGSADHVALFTE